MDCADHKFRDSHACTVSPVIVSRVIHIDSILAPPDELLVGTRFFTLGLFFASFLVVLGYSAIWRLYRPNNGLFLVTEESVTAHRTRAVKFTFQILRCFLRYRCSGKRPDPETSSFLAAVAIQQVSYRLVTHRVA